MLMGSGFYFLDHPLVVTVAGLILLLFGLATRFHRRRKGPRPENMTNER
jgi:hypothetical protein